MRRRERWRNLAWLQWLDGDSGQSTSWPPEAATVTVDEALMLLLTHFSRYVEMERQGDTTLVRILPGSAIGQAGELNFGMLYRGTSLKLILSTAVQECDSLAKKSIAFRVGAKAIERWVPCW